MRESSLNQTIRTNVKKHPAIFAQRIENACGNGVPDLYLKNKITGRSAWVENKLLKEFPKRADTVVKIDHYTAEQRLWLREHGNGAWLFVQVGDEYFLFDHVAAQLVGAELTQADWRRLAVDGGWKKPCPWGAFFSVTVG